MKRNIILLLTLISTFVFSGCIDIVQHLTKDADGLDRNIVKITVSKALFEVANAISEDSDNANYEEAFSEFDNTFDTDRYKEIDASIKKINDELEIGYLINIRMDLRNKDLADNIKKSEMSFFHRYEGKNILLHIDKLSDDLAAKDDNDMAEAVFLSAKYRLIVSKKCIANMKRAIVKVNKKNTELAFIDLSDAYLLEIPISVLIANAIDIVLESV